MNASSRVLFNATQFAVIASNFGSMVETASPSENLVMACNHILLIDARHNLRLGRLAEVVRVGDRRFELNEKNVRGAFGSHLFDLVHALFKVYLGMFSSVLTGTVLNSLIKEILFLFLCGTNASSVGLDSLNLHS